MAESIKAAIAYKKRHPDKSVLEVSKIKNVPSSTLYDHMNGAHPGFLGSSSRVLSDQQEKAVIDKINEYASFGCLLSPRQISDFVETLGGSKPGAGWWSRFQKRHGDKIHRAYSDTSTRTRFAAEKRSGVESFYKLLKSAFDKYSLQPQNLYNADETSFDFTSQHSNKRVRPAQSNKISIDETHGERVTVLACIGATMDAAVSPLVTYRGQYLQDDWSESNNPVARISQLATCNLTAWNSDDLQLQWLTDVFDPQTRSTANGQPRFLLLDGAKTHVKVSFIDACLERQIYCVLLPKHLTHCLQPLDVSFFNTLKLKYNQSHDNWRTSAQDRVHVKKGLFWQWHKEAWKATWQRQMIAKAWKESGIWPLSLRHMTAGIPDQIDISAAGAASAELPSTPDCQTIYDITTPTSSRTQRQLSTKLRRGEVSPKLAVEKAQNYASRMEALNKIQQMEIEKLQKSIEDFQKSASSKTRARYPLGELYGPSRRQEQATELNRRKNDRDAKKRSIGAVSRGAEPPAKRPRGRLRKHPLPTSIQQYDQDNPGL